MTSRRRQITVIRRLITGCRQAAVLFALVSVCSMMRTCMELRPRNDCRSFCWFTSVKHNYYAVVLIWVHTFSFGLACELQ